ncbi:MAG: tol-pal system protein YbgF [Methyloprofundus sp.]|nr:tol-pal system protein YbgF [Methyloprofundus sp.]
MKKILLITGLCVQSVAYAEPKALPPIINHSSYANGAPYIGNAASSKPMLEMLGRVERLQQEIQQLRGLLEEQAYEINNLKKRQKNSYLDIDQRLQQLEKERGIVGEVTEYHDLAAPMQASQSNVAEKAAFDKAFASVRSSDYPQAIKLFKQFLQDYPAGEYSDNATFWLASTYKVVNDLAKAKPAFQRVYTQFPDSEKAGLAMMKLADIYAEENELQKAKQLYRQIGSQYAETSSAHRAAEKLQSIGL